MFHSNGRWYYKYICDDCGCELDKLCSLAHKGFGCPVCSNRVIIAGINDIATTDRWMIKFFEGGEEEAKLYSKSCSKKIFPICPYCGRKKKTPLSINMLYTRKGFGCNCKDNVSIPNKIIFNIASQLLASGQAIYIQNEYKLECDHTRSYDMYLIRNDGFELLVEMDGGMGHGYAQSKSSCVSVSPEEAIKNDEYKNALASINGIKLIRIDCFKSDVDYIKANIIRSELSNIFDLSVIDWNEVGEYAYSNLVKEVCNYKREHPDCFTTDLTKIFGLDRSTISKYWKIGESFGWCEYNRSDEKNRKIKRDNVIPSFYKRVLINDGKSIKIFNSITDFIRESESIYGVKITKKMFDLRSSNEFELNNLKIKIL